MKTAADVLLCTLLVEVVILCVWHVLRSRAADRARYQPPRDWPRPFDFNSLQPPSALPRVRPYTLPLRKQP